MAGFGGLVTESGADDRDLGKAYEFLRRELSPVDVVADEIGVAAGLPGEVDGVGEGNGDKAGGGGWWEDVGDLEGDWRGDGAPQFEGVSVEGYGADSLRGVAIGFAFDGGRVENAAGVGMVLSGLEPNFRGRLSSELEGQV